MLLHSLFYVLLRVADIEFARFETRRFVDYYRTPAFPTVGAGFLVPAVTIKIFEIPYYVEKV